VALLGAVMLTAGCERSERRQARMAARQKPVITGQPVQQPVDSATDEVPVPTEPETGVAGADGAAEEVILDNPTTRAGRGAPSLDVPGRPSAWIYMDGHVGRFVEENGQPLLQMVIDEPVSPMPTFRVEVYEPLLGRPRTARFFLQDVGGTGALVRYAFAANDTFQVGHDYYLCNPGESFTVRANPLTPDEEEVDHFGPLPPGAYLIAVSVEGENPEDQTAAVTFFTVGGETSEAAEQGGH